MTLAPSASKSAASSPKGQTMPSDPIGFNAASGEWNSEFADRSMEERDWNSLTFGEQQGYAIQDCRTKGALYTSTISARRVEFSVALPESLALKGLTEAEAKQIERQLHRIVEDRIVWILREREMRGL